MCDQPFDPRSQAWVFQKKDTSGNLCSDTGKESSRSVHSGVTKVTLPEIPKNPHHVPPPKPYRSGNQSVPATVTWPKV